MVRWRNRRLIDACRSGDVRAVERLLRRNADPNTRAEKDRLWILFFPLKLAMAFTAELNAWWLCRLGNGLARKVDAIRHPDALVEPQYGTTPLMNAAKYGHCDIIECLVRAGARLEDRDKDGWTALIYATFANQTGAIRTLIKMGALVDGEDGHGRTALGWSGHCRGEAKEVAETLIGAGAKFDESTLRSVIVGGNVGITQMLIERGVDVNAKYDDGLTPLILSAFAGTPETAQALIDAGADVNAKTPQGYTPLMSVVNADIAGVMIEGGADLHIKDAAGKTALDHAIAREQKYRPTHHSTEVIQVLRDADENAPS